MSSLRKWAAADKKVESSPGNLAVEQCLDSIKEYFECSICRDNLDRPIQTKCGHVFCSKCLQNLSKQPNATCPLCKVKISNRSLIVREDVSDMMDIVARLSAAFTSEVERYFDSKVTPRKISSSSGASTGGAVEKVDYAPKAGKSSKTTLAKEMIKVTIKGKTGMEKDTPSKLDGLNKPEETGKIKAIRKNNEDRTSLDSDDQEQHVPTCQNGSPDRKQNPAIDAVVVSGHTRPKKSTEVILDIQSIEALSTKSKETVGDSSSSEVPKDNKSQELARESMLEKMRKQTYCIMDSGIETVPSKNKSQSPGKPMDLSLSRRRSAQFTEYVYREKPITIRYVKPLDLSVKNEKRKFEDVNATTSVNLGSNKPTRPVPSSAKLDCSAAPPQSPQRKRGKFEDNGVRSKEQEPQSSTYKPLSLTSKRTSVELDCVVDFETRPEDDEEPNDDNNDPVFTPTPPPPIQNISVSKKKEPTQKVYSAKKLVRPSQFNIESQVMKDFDLPFDEDEMETGNPSSGGKVTSSDELLCNITEESVMRDVRGRSQAKSGQSKAATKTSKEKEQFVFKQPSGLITQGPKKKSKDIQTKKDDVFMECDDDEFQQPRDSDFMFLDLTCGGGSGSAKGGGDRANKPNSNDSSPSNEKENSGKRLSLSRSGSKRTSPVKSTPSTLNEKSTKALPLAFEDTDLNINQILKPTDDLLGAFDDDDDEDWLLDIPMEGESRRSGKRMSGKSKQSEDKTKEVPEIVPTLSVPLKSQKQRYVFCPTRLTKHQMLKLQQLCKMCDGVITKDFSPEVTHLIINLVAGRVPQTLKYLLAIAGRKWVVIYDWVEECVNAGKLVSEDQFETSNYKQCDPGVRRSRLAKRDLFDGFKFYFATEHYKTMGFTKEEVSKLMETLGGTVVDAPKDIYRDLIIIGSKNGNSTDYNHWLHANKWATVTFEWVIGCILEYRLKQFDPTFLCIDVTAVKSINAPKTFQAAFSQYMTQLSEAMSPA